MKIKTQSHLWIRIGCEIKMPKYFLHLFLRVLVSAISCCNKLLQNYGLKKKNYRHTVLESQSLKWVSLSENTGVGRAAFFLEAPGENCYLTFSSFWKLPALLAHGLFSI